MTEPDCAPWRHSDRYEVWSHHKQVWDRLRALADRWEGNPVAPGGCIAELRTTVDELERRFP